MTMDRTVLEAVLVSAHTSMMECVRRVHAAPLQGRKNQLKELEASCQHLVNVCRGAYLRPETHRWRVSPAEVVFQLDALLPEIGLLAGQYGLSVRTLINSPKGLDQYWDETCIRVFDEELARVHAAGRLVPAANEDRDETLPVDAERSLAELSAACIELIVRVRHERGLAGFIRLPSEQAELLAKWVDCDVVSLTLEGKRADPQGDTHVNLWKVCLIFAAKAKKVQDPWAQQFEEAVGAHGAYNQPASLKTA